MSSIKSIKSWSFISPEKFQNNETMSFSKESVIDVVSSISGRNRKDFYEILNEKKIKERAVEDYVPEDYVGKRQNILFLLIEIIFLTPRLSERKNELHVVPNIHTTNLSI